MSNSRCWSKNAIFEVNKCMLFFLWLEYTCTDELHTVRAEMFWFHVDFRCYTLRNNWQNPAFPIQPLTSDSVACLVNTRGTLTQFTPANQAKSVAYLWIERNRGAILRETRANDEIHGCHDSNTDHAHARRGGGWQEHVREMCGRTADPHTKQAVGKRRNLPRAFNTITLKSTGVCLGKKKLQFVYTKTNEVRSLGSDQGKQTGGDAANRWWKKQLHNGFSMDTEHLCKEFAHKMLVSAEAVFNLSWVDAHQLMSRAPWRGLPKPWRRCWDRKLLAVLAVSIAHMWV